MAGDVQRAALLSSLDATWDTFKRLARLELKAINPVAAVLNLLPLNWDARIVKMVDSENGVISVQHKEAGADMSGDLGLVVTNIFVIFNILQANYWVDASRQNKLTSYFACRTKGDDRTCGSESGYQGR